MKKRWLVYTCMAIIMSCVTLFSACAPVDYIKNWLFGDGQEDNLQTIEATFDQSTLQLSWKVDAEATLYKVVVNQQEVYSIDTWTTTYLTYDFHNALVEGEIYYRFYVKAYDDNDNTRKSTDFYYEKSYTATDINGVVYDDTMAPTGLLCSQYSMQWNETSKGEYLAVISAGVDDTKYIKTTEESINIYKYLRDDKVYMLNVGVLIDNILYVTEEPVYHNTENDNDAASEFTKKVYYFHGKYHDFYINNQEELDALFYYAYIFKKDSLEFQCASGFANSVDILNTRLETSKDKMTETYVYRSTLQSTAKYGYSYKLTLDFYDQEEPTRVNEDQQLAVDDRPYIGYYENYDGGITQYVSDTQLVRYSVVTSDQLYHVIESGATPIFSSNTSSAYLIYQKAKTILNEIIDPTMTEYEKALSIFDWISLNVQYDHEVVDNIALDGSDRTTTTAYNAFFLEGVFDDGIAVCDGFAKAYSLLCNMVGVECTRITGLAKTGTTSGGHAWNKVKIGANWYVVDVTWSNEHKTTYELDTHSYCFVTDNYIADTHTPYDTAFDTTMPATDNSLCYYANIGFVVGSTIHGRYVSSSNYSGMAGYVASYLNTYSDNSIELAVLSSAKSSFVNKLYGLTYVVSMHECVYPTASGNTATCYIIVVSK